MKTYASVNKGLLGERQGGVTSFGKRPQPKILLFFNYISLLRRKMEVRKVTLPHVGGMPVHLHFLSTRADGALTTDLPVAVAFLLHGRLGESGALDGTAAALVHRCAGGATQPKRNLIVVSLDHRNHGHRRVRDLAKYPPPQ
jgi:hypothetical protein